MQVHRSILIFMICCPLPGAGVNAQQQGNPKDTEVWDPEPAVVAPGQHGGPPSDAIVLFDGSDLSLWQHEDGSDATWQVEDGVVTVVVGTRNIQTRQSFGNVQLHIEWQAPIKIEGEGQGRGNSGVFLQKTYEVQVLDSYQNRTYANGQAASLYKQHIPLVNASKSPGEWQAYDIVFEAPGFDDDGSLLNPAYVTVLHNNVLVQNHVELRGPTLYIGEPSYNAHPDKQPLMLQHHGNPVSYRNIWIRELAGD
jgi:hypothetical protein